MKPNSLRAATLLAILIPLAAQAAAPVNDKFANARVLTAAAPVLLNQTGVGSTPDALDPFIGGVKLTRSVWYRVDAPLTTPFTRIIIKDTPGVRAGVFELLDPDGNAGTLKFITQTNNIQANDIETLTFASVASQRYYLCVEGNGTFDVTFQSTLQSNDYFANAINLPGIQGTITGSNIGASNVNDLPTTLPSDFPAAGVWYTWTPGVNATVVVDTNFSSRAGNFAFDTKLAVFTGTTLATVVPVATDDDSGFGINSRVTFLAAQGTVYRIWVGGYGSQTGPFYLSYFQEGNPGVFEITNVSEDVSENQGMTNFRVRRFRGGNVPTNVTISTANVTATAGQDYTALNTVLNFPIPVNNDLGWSQTVNLNILQDSQIEISEMFNLILSANSAGSSIGSSSPSSVAIVNLTSAVAPSFQVSEMRVKENVGLVTIPINRSRGNGMVTVEIKSVAATSEDATPGLDYEAVSEVITFQEGQTQVLVNLFIQNDGFYEGNETIQLFISPVAAGLTFIGSNYLNVTIEDDDLALPFAGRLTTTLDSGGIAGSVDIKLTTTGSVTGKVVTARGSLPFRGKLVNGQLTVALGSATASIRTLKLELLNAATKTFLITLSDGELGTVSTSTVTATNFTAVNPCLVAGYHTFADSGGGGVPRLCAASIKVTAAGDATMTGKLFDGTAIAASGAVDSTNTAWVGATLYAGKGRALASAVLQTATQKLGSSSFSLLRPGRANQSAELPTLDTNNINAVVARYVRPTVGQRALSVWNPVGAGNADLSGGGFAVLTIKPLTVSTANKVLVNVNLPENLKLTLNPATGFFTGTVIPTGSMTPKTIYGVLLQGGAQSIGRGFFLNGILPGKIDLRGP